ncbi:pentatricopeptide repeat-containing protein [Trifolium repens]|nr:pentatricopeptide repeat-containing protein [Trifolium repens]
MTRTLALSHRFSLLRTLLAFISSNPCNCSQAIFSCPEIEPIFRLIDGKPSVSLCNILIHGFVKSGRFDRAFEFYNQMVKDRIKPA